MGCHRSVHRPAGWGGAVVCLLVGGRRSPEGERAVIEPSRGGALSQDPEPVNPRVGPGERRVPFPDFDEVGSGDGGCGDEPSTPARLQRHT
jgi:hypothetical protein